jgi:hypothetical protein
VLACTSYISSFFVDGAPTDSARLIHPLVPPLPEMLRRLVVCEVAIGQPLVAVHETPSIFHHVDFPQHPHAHAEQPVEVEAIAAGHEFGRLSACILAVGKHLFRYGLLGERPLHAFIELQDGAALLKPF